MRLRPSHARHAPDRRGVVLLVVIALLALFASVALSFVFYAEAQADAARLARQAQSPHGIDDDPELLLAYFLNQLLFDVRDDALGVGSALRGHGLLRSTWGADYDLAADGTLQLNNTTVAYGGTGRLHHVYPAAAPRSCAARTITSSSTTPTSPPTASCATPNASASAPA